MNNVQLYVTLKGHNQHVNIIIFVI